MLQIWLTAVFKEYDQNHKSDDNDKGQMTR